MKIVWQTTVKTQSFEGVESLSSDLFKSIQLSSNQKVIRRFIGKPARISFEGFTSREDKVYPAGEPTPDWSEWLSVKVNGHLALTLYNHFKGRVGDSVAA